MIHYENGEQYGIQRSLMGCSWDTHRRKLMFFMELNGVLAEKHGEW